jgi:Flp pilus assembly protein TadG
MTQTIGRFLVAGAAALAAGGGIAGAAVAGGRTGGHGERRVVVVADSGAPATAHALAHRVHAELRLPRTPTEQLAVTHLFAARGYTIVSVGLVRRIAVDPVLASYPATRFVLRRAGRPSGDVTVAACPPSC